MLNKVFIVLASFIPAGMTLAIPQVLSDSSGQISEIMLQYDPEMGSELYPLYRDLFGHIPFDWRVTILCPTQTDACRFEAVWGEDLATSGCSYRTIVTELPISIWARDRLIARHDNDNGGRAINMVPSANGLYDVRKRNELDIHLGLAVEKEMAPASRVAVHLEGGNLVASDHHAFVGSNVLRDNGDLAESDLRAALQDMTGKKVVLVGDHYGDVPTEHLDMYVTPLGPKLVAVGSVQMTGQVFQRRPESDAIGQGEDGWESHDWEDFERFEDMLDEVAEQIALLGYEIVRLPILIDPAQDWIITYNNVVQDVRENGRHIYVPKYNIPDLDAVAQGIFRARGFTVHPIDVSRIFHNGGAVRCVVNVISRMGITAKPRQRPETIRPVLQPT
ncbi:MAG: agmatine deiminase family protein [Planctomycetota bacterium]|jgi:hypothetical protein